MIRVMTINCKGGGRYKVPLIVEFGNKHKIDIIAIQETWAREKTKLVDYTRKYKSFTSGHSRTDGLYDGVQLLIAESLSHRIQSTKVLVQARAIEVNLGDFICICAYAKSKKEDPEIFEAMAKATIGRKTIIIGDLNRDIERSRLIDGELTGFLERTGLKDLALTFSMERQITFKNSSGTSNIDRILVSPEIESLAMEMNLMEIPEIQTDHKAVMADLFIGDIERVSQPLPDIPRIDWKYKKESQWREISRIAEPEIKEVANLLGNLSYKERIERRVELFGRISNSLTKAAVEIFGLARNNTGKPEWNSAEMKTLTKKARRLVRALRAFAEDKTEDEVKRRIRKTNLGDMHPFDWAPKAEEELKNVRLEIQHIMEDWQKERADRFMNELQQNYLSNQGKFFAKTRQRTPFSLRSVLVNGNIKTDPETVKMEVWKFWKTMAEKKQGVILEQDIGSYVTDWTSVLDPIESDADLKTFIKKLGNNKAPGDNFYNEYAKYGSNSLIQAIRIIINDILKSKSLPKEWNKGVVFPLLKGGNPADLNNLRPITLLPFFWKLVARILAYRMAIIMEGSNFFGEIQGGFRTGHVTTDLCMAMQTVIEESEETKNPLWVSFLDISKAYDSVPQEAVWERLKGLNAPVELTDLLQGMYSNATACVLTHYGPTQEFRIERGMRQGCPLSPLLFLIFFQPILNRLGREQDNKGFKILGCDVSWAMPTEIKRDISLSIMGFADDVVILRRNKEDLLDAMQIFNNFLLSNRMELNFKKTKILVSNDIYSPIILDGKEIERVEKFCYLGVWIPTGDNQMLHVQAKNEAKLQMILEDFKGTNEQKLLVYNATIPSIASYGAEVHDIDGERLDIEMRKYLRKKFSMNAVPNYFLHEKPNRGGLGIRSIGEEVLKARIAGFVRILNNSKSIAHAPLVNNLVSSNFANDGATTLGLFPTLDPWVKQTLTKHRRPTCRRLIKALKDIDTRISFRTSLGYDTAACLRPFDPEGIPINLMGTGNINKTKSGKAIQMDRENKILRVPLEKFIRMKKTGITVLKDIIDEGTIQPCPRSFNHLSWKATTETVLQAIAGMEEKQQKETTLKEYLENLELLEGEENQLPNYGNLCRLLNKGEILNIGNGGGDKKKVEVLFKKQDIPIIFTDGSVIDGKAGAGITFGVSNFALRVSGGQTIGRAELTAILAATKLMPKDSSAMEEEMTQTTDKITVTIPGLTRKIGAIIYTDSLTSIFAIRRILKGKEADNRSIVNAILKEMESKNFSIKIEKIKAHSGIIGNELADALAKKGTLRSDAGFIRHSENHNRAVMIYDSRISEDDPREIIKTIMEKKRGSLNPQPIARKESFICLKPQNKFFKNRIFCIKLRSGTLGTLQNISKYLKIEEILCKCGKSETVDHVLRYCPCYEMTRKTIQENIIGAINGINKRDIDWRDFEWNTNRVLGYVDERLIEDFNKRGVIETERSVKEFHIKMIQGAWELWIERMRKQAERIPKRKTETNESERTEE